MNPTFLEKIVVWIILFSGIFEIILTRMLLIGKKDRFFIRPDKGLLVLYILQFMFLGMISLCLPSVFHKLFLNIPLRLKGFITPIIMGSLYGLVTGMLIFHLKKRNCSLERAMEKSRFNENKFKNLFNILPYGAEVMDISRVIVAVSTNSCRFLGYGKEEMIGKNLAEYIHPDDIGLLIEKIEMILTEQDLERNITQVRLRHKNGEYKTVLRSSSVVYNENGQVSGILFVNTDITCLKAREDENQKLAQKLVQTQKLEALGKLAGGIAHDFKNILSPIIGFSEMLTDSLPVESKDWEKAEKIHQAGIRGKELTSQILDFSRHTDMEKQSVNLKVLLSEIINLNRAVLPEHIEIQEKIDKNCFPILAAPSHIHQIGMNLITNAIQAIGSSRGVITVSLENSGITEKEARQLGIQKGIYVHLSIRDTGTGIKEELLKKVLEPYFTTKSPGKGTGLGLSIINELVKEMLGSITLQSFQGKGTDVSIYLPADTRYVYLDLSKEIHDSLRGIVPFNQTEYPMKMAPYNTNEFS